MSRRLWTKSLLRNWPSGIVAFKGPILARQRPESSRTHNGVSSINGIDYTISFISNSVVNPHNGKGVGATCNAVSTCSHVKAALHIEEVGSLHSVPFAPRRPLSPNRTPLWVVIDGCIVIVTKIADALVRHLPQKVFNLALPETATVACVCMHMREVGAVDGVHGRAKCVHIASKPDMAASCGVSRFALRYHLHDATTLPKDASEI